jgi:predicted esterase
MLRTLPARLVAAAVIAQGLLAASRAAPETVPVPPAAVASDADLPPPLPVAPLHRTQIGVPEHNPLEIYPPSAPGLGGPLILALHGKGQDPIDLCEGFGAEGGPEAWLVCPAGNTDGTEPGEDFDWGGSIEDRLAALDAQLAAVETVYGPLVDHEAGDVVVGFSRGAFLARDLVYARPGRFRGMVLLGAALSFDVDRLRAAGVKRVLLAAGEKDDAFRSMEHAASFLTARGIPARFVGLGPIYHKLPADLGRVMRDALRWVREGEA